MSLPLVIFAALAVTLPQGPPLGDAFLPEPVPAPQTAPDADAEPTAHDAYIDCLRMAANEPERAERLANEWIAANGGVPARHCLGEAEMSLGKTSDAAGDFAAAAGIAEAEGLQQDAELYRLAAEAALIGGELARGEELVGRAFLALDEGDRAGEAAVRKLRSRVAVAKGDLTTARADLAAATEANPDDEEIWLLLATAARRDDDMPAAEAAIREAVRLAPDDEAVQAEAMRIALSEEESAAPR